MTGVLNYDRIKGLIYTEKSNQQLADSKYHFKVSSKVTRSEVSALIKKIFSVEVEKVNILNSKPKKRKFKGVEGLRSGYKKAIVTLKEGQSINFDS
jgi:large subunit ribosomal protein L23